MPRPHQVRARSGPQRPLALLFVCFHVVAPLCYLLHRLRHRARFDLVQMVESNLCFGDISYAHFCHRAYYEDHRHKTGGSGLLYRLRVLDHLLHAWMEPWVFRTVKMIVVPSEGLARELKQRYPKAADKITILSNPVDVERMRRPADFDRESFRQKHGLAGPIWR